MDIQFNKIHPNQGVLSITLYEPDYKTTIEKQLKYYAQNIRLKGFRAGAVPPHLVKKMYGTSILIEELNKIALDALKRYMLQEKLPVFMEPLLVSPNRAVDLTSQDTFTFTYEVALTQDHPIVFGSDISITEFEIESVEPELIDQFVQGLQIVHGQTTELEASSLDSMLHGDLTNDQEGVGLEVRLSVSHIPDHLRMPFLNLSIGSKVIVTEEVLQNHSSALLGISSVDFKAFKKYDSPWPATFRVNKIVHVAPASIESSFFDLVLGKGVASTEDEFREAIAKIILFDKRNEARYAFYEDLQKELFKHNPVELPDEFLKKWLSLNNPEATETEVLDYYNENKEELRWEFLLSTIVRQNGLVVTSSEVVDETKRAYIDYADKNGLALGDLADNSEAMHAGALSFLQGKEGNKYYVKLYNQLNRDKAISFVKDKISIIKENVTVQEFDARR